MSPKINNLQPHLLILIVLVFTACSNDGNEVVHYKETNLVNIAGRNTNMSKNRTSIYQMLVPNNWTLKEPSASESLIDTKKPIYELIIDEGEQEVRITIHNFPTNSIDERVPPEAQAARWKQQLGGDKIIDAKTIPQSFGGYSGLRFEGIGHIGGEKLMVIGWSMQLSQEHFYALSQEHEGLTNEEREQMRGDYTIKVVGSPEKVKNLQESINRFARSFRLMQPIPDKR